MMLWLLFSFIVFVLTLLMVLSDPSEDELIRQWEKEKKKRREENDV